MALRPFAAAVIRTTPPVLPIVVASPLLLSDTTPFGVADHETWLVTSCMMPFTTPVTRNCWLCAAPPPAFRLIVALGGVIVSEVSPGMLWLPPPELLLPCKFDGLNAHPSAPTAHTNKQRRSVPIAANSTRAQRRSPAASSGRSTPRPNSECWQ